MHSPLALISLFNNDPYGSHDIRHLSGALKSSGYPHFLIFHSRAYHDARDGRRFALLTDEEISLFLERLKELKVTLAGISVYYFQSAAAKQLTCAIKKHLGIPVIWGGVWPTFGPEECIEHTDLLCRGEGEEALVEVLQRFECGKGARDVLNIWSRESGSIFRNPLRVPAWDFTHFPFTLFDEETSFCLRADRPNLKLRHPSYYRTMASKGCWFSCSYCVERQLFQHGYRYRTRAVANIIAELEEAVKRYAPRLVIFEDALFPIEPQWIHAFAQAYKKEIDLPFYLRTRSRLVNEDTISVLADAGLRSVNLGIESGSERLRSQVFKRQETDASIAQAQRIISRHAVKTSGNLIIDNPFETEADFRRAVDFFLDFPSRIRLVLSSLVFFPKTQITERARSEGLVDPYRESWAKQRDSVLLFFNYRRSRQEQFRDAIICLITVRLSYGFPPKAFIRALSSSRFLHRHPFFLFWLCFSFRSLIIKTGRLFSTP